MAPCVMLLTLLHLLCASGVKPSAFCYPEHEPAGTSVTKLCMSKQNETACDEVIESCGWCTEEIMECMSLGNDPGLDIYCKLQHRIKGRPCESLTQCQWRCRQSAEVVNAWMRFLRNMTWTNLMHALYVSFPMSLSIVILQGWQVFAILIVACVGWMKGRQDQPPRAWDNAFYTTVMRNKEVKTMGSRWESHFDAVLLLRVAQAPAQLVVVIWCSHKVGCEHFFTLAGACQAQVIIHACMYCIAVLFALWMLRRWEAPEKLFFRYIFFFLPPAYISYVKKVRSFFPSQSGPLKTTEKANLKAVYKAKDTANLGLGIGWLVIILYCSQAFWVLQAYKYLVTRTGLEHAHQLAYAVFLIERGVLIFFALIGLCSWPIRPFWVLYALFNAFFGFLTFYVMYREDLLFVERHVEQRLLDDADTVEEEEAVARAEGPRRPDGAGGHYRITPTGQATRGERQCIPRSSAIDVVSEVDEDVTICRKPPKSPMEYIGVAINHIFLQPEVERVTLPAGQRVTLSWATNLFEHTAHMIPDVNIWVERNGHQTETVLIQSGQTAVITRA